MGFRRLGPFCWLAGLYLFSAGCVFDGSAPKGQGATPDAAGTDSPIDCPEDLHLELLVNGIADGDEASPRVKALVGDRVQLSAGNSCSRSGSLTYTWSLSPPLTGIQETALPNASSREIEVYGPEVDSYNVTLTVTDEGGNTKSQTTFAFQTFGFESVPGFADPRKVFSLEVGAEFLWVGSEIGAFRTPLASLSTPFVDLNDLRTDGPSIPDDIEGIREDTANATLWLGSDKQESRAFAFELGTGIVRAPDLEANARARDVFLDQSLVVYATDKGLFSSNDRQTFTRLVDGNFRSVDRLQAEIYFGGDDLFRIGQAAIDVFPEGGDDKIEAIEPNGDDLWVASDEQGVALVRNNSVTTVWTTGQGISSNNVRDIAIEESGDVWLATGNGVSRYLADRDVWIAMRTDENLTGDFLKQRAIAIDESNGRRAVFCGTDDGVVVMRVP